MMRSDATVTKREHMLAIYKEKESYKRLQEFQDRTSEPGLSTPRCDVPKRTWEKRFYEWKMSLKALDSEGGSTFNF